VVDAFGITVPAVNSVDVVRDQLEEELYAVLPTPPAKPVEEAS
jgi:[protein-PII] uridylyltransferase